MFFSDGRFLVFSSPFLFLLGPLGTVQQPDFLGALLHTEDLLPNV